MSKKLFTGTTNGLELWVDGQVLEKLRQEREIRLAARLNPDGTKINKKVTKPPKLIDTFIRQFLDDVSQHNGCWISKENPTMTHYRRILFCGRLVLLHRLIYLLTRGEINDPSVCHHCDNPPCCNPNHLFNGTQKINVLDCIQKDRGNRPYGELASAAKLTNDEVLEIRKTYKRYSKTFGTPALAQKYGLGQASVSKIVLGKTWRKVV